MKRYNPSEIEPKWQKVWQDEKTYKSEPKKDQPKAYISGMFPYPSGAGMHTGHAFSYTIVDTLARFYRQQGVNVLNPMGWDTFGLPAENYAIKTGTAPKDITKVNIDNFRKQFKRMGVSIDWDREINTSDPGYYKWTQWIFTKLYEHGLAYQKESMQWWCDTDKTVLANEQVEGGKCWRCGNEVTKRSMKQWFFKITEYADDLLDGISSLDWPNKIKVAQTNWIGKSIGAEVDFKVAGKEESLKVFTTRPDTLFGATFIVVAPEHDVLKTVPTEFKNEVDAYVKASLKRSEIERMSDSKDKTGVFTGLMAINPVNGKEIPVWTSDYVLSGYGTGAIMAVPAHDDRDYGFAKKFDLPIVEVIEKPEDYKESGCYSGEGILVNSGDFDGKESSEAREDIVSWLEERNIGKTKVNYKMRDWLISRQRYWGAPIPIVHCDDCGAVAVPEEDLPVLLPDIEDYAPKGDGGSVLASVKSWVDTTCPKCHKPAKRETDTMDGYACSSWYLLRFCDPHNDKQAWDKDIVNYYAPVDTYVGADHAVAHLLYVRFWTRFFNKLGLVDFKEPVKKLIYHGYINAEDGQKMSKSKGNVIDPLDIIDQGYGADSLRTYVLFMGPVELDAAWDSKGIAGIYRFLNRVFTLVEEYVEVKKDGKRIIETEKELKQLDAKTTKKVTEDIYRNSFNTAIASLMEYVNALYKLKVKGMNEEAWLNAITHLVQEIAPFAPHMAEELWRDLGYKEMIHNYPWPTFDESLLKTDTMKIMVQVNGKLRSEILVASDASEESVKTTALNDEKVKTYIKDKAPKRVIYVKGRIINIVI